MLPNHIKTATTELVEATLGEDTNTIQIDCYVLDFS